MLTRSVGATFLFSFFLRNAAGACSQPGSDESPAAHAITHTRPPDTHTQPRTCDTPEGAKCIEKEPLTSPPEEGVSRLMRGEER